tara:strand:+ start:123 stop:1037 length:915 start_codon:yes stop_codon:yes gene_type:complete
MRNKSEFIEWFNLHNGIMNCYTTVYNFSEYSETIQLDHSVILDRMFLDFDAHDKPLVEAYDDYDKLRDYYITMGIKFDSFFSGKGFHMIVYGEVVDDIRCIQQYYTKMAIDYPTLDRTGIQTKRLRRLPNSMNLSSDGYFCIPLDKKYSLSNILKLAKKPHLVSSKIEGKLIQWPKVKSMKLSDVEVDIPTPLGRLPILPCLHNAITVENPSHYARVYLIQWYRDLLSLGERSISLQKQQEIIDAIMTELDSIASGEDMWLDWDEPKTRGYVTGIVRKGYNAAGCKSVLIPQGYCVGKCWRYTE